VDLRGRLANPGVREVVATAAEAIDGVNIGDGKRALPLPGAGGWWTGWASRSSSSCLLTGAVGVTKRELDERYGISLSSVKRILKRARRG
jgi:hypothetical protein